MAGVKSYRPLIGISGPDKGGAIAWLFSWLAVVLAGGRAIRLTPKKGGSVDRLDGLILGGGADIDPELYGEELTEPVPPWFDTTASFGQKCLDWIFFPLIFILRWLFSAKTFHLADKRRDDFETSLLENAVQCRIPVLGICRGAQLLNTYFGGSLHQSLHEFYEEIPHITSVFPKKKINIASGSRLAEILGENTCMVNALHRQAINKLGQGFAVVAQEETGIIQAIESQSQQFLLGVQWHPEYLPQHSSQRALFKALVQAAHHERPLPD